MTFGPQTFITAESKPIYIEVTTSGIQGEPGISNEGVIWDVLISNVIMKPRRGYICEGLTLLLLTLPVVAQPGDLIHIFSQSEGLFRVTQNAGQQIRFGNAVTTRGLSGRIDSLAQGDMLTLLCSTSTNWVVTAPLGNFEVV